MLWNSRMRWSTDLNESSPSKSTEPEILSWSSSATPEGAGEERPRNSERDRSASGAARPPESRPEGPGWGEWVRPDAERSLPEQPPPARGRLEGGGGIALTLTSESDSEEEEADILAERAERAGKGDRPPIRFPPEQDLSQLDDRLQRFSGREDSWACSTGRSGRRGCTSRSRRTWSGQHRRASNWGCWWHRCSRGRHTPSTGDSSSWQKRPQNRTLLIHDPRQAEEQPDKVREKGCGKSGGATCNRRGGLHRRPRVASIPGSNNSLRVIPATPSRPPTPLPRPPTVRRRRAVTWPVAGPVWLRAVTSGLVTASRSQAQSSWPRERTRRSR